MTHHHIREDVQRLNRLDTASGDVSALKEQKSSF